MLSTVLLLTDWLKVLRLRMSLLAGFLPLISYRVLGGTETPWLVMVTVVVIAGVTMAQNDWRDRYHDQYKGRTLALCQPRAFFWYVVGLWLVAVLLTVAVAVVHDARQSVVLAALIVVGLTYSEARRVPCASMLVVALTVATPLALPLNAYAPTVSWWLLCLCVFCVVLAREIAKDIEDLAIDVEYKQTLPVMVGEHLSYYAVFVFATIAVICMLVLTNVSAYGVVVFVFMACGIYMLMAGKIKQTMLCVDAAAIITMLYLLR